MAISNPTPTVPLHIIKHRTSLVVQGFRQQHSINYYETFSPVAKLATIWMFLAVALHHNWSVLNSMFLTLSFTASLTKLYACKSHQALIRTSNIQIIYVYYRALDELNQESCQWHPTFFGILLQQDFCFSTGDPSLLIYSFGNTELFILIYIDREQSKLHY